MCCTLNFSARWYLESHLAYWNTWCVIRINIFIKPLFHPTYESTFQVTQIKEVACTNATRLCNISKWFYHFVQMTLPCIVFLLKMYLFIFLSGQEPSQLYWFHLQLNIASLVVSTAYIIHRCISLTFALLIQEYT